MAAGRKKGEIYPGKVVTLLQTLANGYWHSTYQVVCSLYGNKAGYHTNIKKRLSLLTSLKLAEHRPEQGSYHPTHHNWRITQAGLDYINNYKGTK